MQDAGEQFSIIIEHQGHLQVMIVMHGHHHSLQVEVGMILVAHKRYCMNGSICR